MNNSQYRKIFIIVFATLLMAAAGWLLVKPLIERLQEASLTPADVAYLSPVNSPEIWLWRAAHGEAVPITQTQGRVFDFDVSPDGRFIVFSQTNEQGGRDLMRVQIVTRAESRLLACGQSLCFQPAISPDGKQVAYTVIDPQADAQAKAVQRVFVLDLAGRSQRALYEDETISASQPAWSPQGDRLAVVDEANREIRVISLSTGDTMTIPTQVSEMGAFSPDGAQMMFLNAQMTGIQSFQGVYLADFTDQQIRAVIAPYQSEVDFGVPAWSAANQKIAVNWRKMIGLGRGTEQISIFEADGSGEQVITTDQNFTHGAYSWSPDGSRLLYQQFEVGKTGAQPEVAIWEMATGEHKVIAQNAFFPRWVP
ncbi:hypothetical protein ADN00_08195 [Ornatilinea apprima]|uniref:Lipoprotein LpqB C-terminal domain-containing protein n=1 Tax=Ornatilinea apprima TaxID=1134406 RepID=A0A0P6XWL7_9CHLR|nr:LpqB family beta-propeller domain-containing protein [Ornatilinea apprima]KPL77853.1 hypothetical protein ADN00_08195 [Ornatilinea apprima]